MTAFCRFFLCAPVAVAVLSLTVGCDPPDPFFVLDDGPDSTVGDVSDDNANDNAIGDSGAVDDGADVTETDPPPPPDDSTPTILDSDGDGFSDEAETNAVPGSDPEDPNDTQPNPIDSDGDGCSDFDERTFVGFCDGNPNTVDPDTIADPETAHTFSLTVARHDDVSFSDAQVDAVFAAGGALLQQVETDCSDLATNTVFTRDGSVTTFSVGGASLTVESELDAVFDVPEAVKIVDFMTGVCGVPQTDDMSVVLGCAFSGGSLVITATAAPDVWVHEWGHVQGLLHRDNCPRNIMHSFEVATNAVDSQERAAFLTSTPRNGKVAVSASPLSQGPSDRLRRASAEPMRDWIHRVAAKDFIAGVPTDVMQDLETEAVDPLLEMLWAPDFSGQRRNVARMLGFTAAPRACDRLMSGIPALTGELSFDELAGAAESILAIGRLSAGDSDDAALRWLMEGCEPAAWAQRGVQWGYRSHRGAAAHRLLARLSIMALGLSGQPAALSHLQSLNIEGFESQIDAAVARLTKTDSALRQTSHPLRQP